MADFDPAIEATQPGSAVVSPAAAARRRGRWLFLVGLVLPFAAFGAYILQFQMRVFTMPWYVPISAVVGLLLVAAAVWMRPGVLRILGLVLVGLFCGVQVLFFSVSKLPTYAGPVHVDETVPAFQAVLADGRPFTEKNLKAGTPTVLVFFRGRW